MNTNQYNLVFFLTGMYLATTYSMIYSMVNPSIEYNIFNLEKSYTQFAEPFTQSNTSTPSEQARKDYIQKYTDEIIKRVQRLNNDEEKNHTTHLVVEAYFHIAKNNELAADITTIKRKLRTETRKLDGKMAATCPITSNLEAILNKADEIIKKDEKDFQKINLYVEEQEKINSSLPTEYYQYLMSQPSHIIHKSAFSLSIKTAGQLIGYRIKSALTNNNEDAIEKLEKKIERNKKREAELFAASQELFNKI